MRQLKVTPMSPKKVKGLSYIVAGLPFEDRLRIRMILLGADEPEDFKRVLLRDPEFCELLAQSLRQAIQAFVCQRLWFVPQELKDEIVQEVFPIVWDAIQDYDPHRGVPLPQFWFRLFLRTFSAYNRQQRIQSQEIVMSVLWDTDGDDHDDSPEDFWEIIADGRNFEEEVIRRDELEKLAFFEGYQNPDELAEAIEKASKIKRHRWRRRLLNLKDQLLRRTKPKRREDDKNHCAQCKRGFRMRSAFRAFGAKYVVAECPRCHRRVVIPAEGGRSRRQAVSTFVGGDKNA
ncbi:hypothetical protein [Fervidibacter sacchari]